MSQAVAVIVRCSALWVYLAAGLFSVMWIPRFTDWGDALMYGANAHPLAIPFVVLAVGIVIPSRFNIGRHSIIRSAGLLLVPFLFWMVALWTSLLVVLWAPTFMLIVWGVDSIRNRLSSKQVAGWVLWQSCCIGFSAMFWSLVVLHGGESGATKFDGVWDAITSHSYIWNNLRLAVVLCLLALIVVRSWKAMGLVIAAGGMLASIIPIAAVNHVSLNFYMPRYFGIPLLFGALIPFLMLSGWLSRRLHLVALPLQWVRAERFAALALGAFGLVGASLLVPQQIGYGTGQRDAMGFVTTGNAMSVSELELVKTITGMEFSFVAGSYWDIWPTVFELRTKGVEILGLTYRAEFQNHYSQLYSGEVVNGLCLGKIESCQDAATYPQLDEILLLTKVDDNPVSTLLDGTPVRLMTVQTP